MVFAPKRFPANPTPSPRGRRRGLPLSCAKSSSAHVVAESAEHSGRHFSLPSRGVQHYGAQVNQRMLPHRRNCRDWNRHRSKLWLPVWKLARSACLIWQMKTRHPPNDHCRAAIHSQEWRIRIQNEEKELGPEITEPAQSRCPARISLPERCLCKRSSRLPAPMPRTG